VTWSSMLVAVWLGLQTAILPCPLATNIAAVSFVGRAVGSPARVFLAGLLYALGRCCAYVIIAWLLIRGVFAQQEIARALETHTNRALGPLLILAGMFLLELLELPSLSLGGQAEAMRKLVERLGLLGALPLGMVFALAFCPPSAALYFLTLIPLCLPARSSLVLPGLYGLGTALPVVAFAFVIAFSAQSLGRIFARLTQMERWIRSVTGVIFILVGIYYALTFIFRVFA